MMSGNKEWFKSWFDSPYYHLLYHKRDENEAKIFIDNLLQFLKPGKEASFLDVACGKGRHAVYLASKGYQVTGIDLSAQSIAEARKQETANLSFYIHDMRNEFYINYFDYAFNFFTSFGYFEADHDNLRVLQNVYKGLKPDGIFVIDFLNAEKAVAEMKAFETKDIEGVHFEIKRSLEAGFITKKIEVHDQQEVLHFVEKVRNLSLEDFWKYFKNIGLDIQEVFGDYPLHPFDAHHSPRLILIAKKKYG